MTKVRGGQGASSVQIRQYNLWFLMQQLRRLGQASKADLARIAGLTATAIGENVRELEGRGLIEAVGKRREGKLGQPATLLRVNETGAFGIGVRIDSGRVETVLVDLGGNIVDHRMHCIDLPPPRDTLALVTADISSLIDAAPAETRNRIGGIGVARPFHRGSWPARRQLADSGTAAQWDVAQFVTDLARATGMTVFDETDGAAGAIAELFYGRQHGADDFFYLFLGPHITGGLVLDGECRRWRTGNGGDIAVMPVSPSCLPSAPKPEGPYDILAARASIDALLRHLRHHDVVVAGPADLPQVMAAQRALAQEWIDDCAAALTGPILSMHALLDVPLVIMDSDLPQPWLDQLIDRLRAILEGVRTPTRSVPQVERGSFGIYSGAIGAASLPLFSSTPSLWMRRR
ncbi:MAG: ROK family transcriptional regulator [Azospirillaceae bacterium]|nr:ROK family transcriptional regulator [Azospirillaceae bacterium]